LRRTAAANRVPAVDAAPRLPVLDGLRGFILFVLVWHFYDPIWLPRATAAQQVVLVGFNLISWAAVPALDVFFVLSGFLITGILLDSKGARSYFRTFYARRALRIFPVYYGVLFLLFFVVPRVYDSPGLRLTPIQHLLYWGYLTNIGMTLGWQPVTGTGHLWSLAVEEQFYLVWPAVVYVCSRARLKTVCIGCLIAAPLCRIALAFTVGDSAGDVFTPARMDGLALGALLSVLFRETGAWPALARRATPMALAAAGTLGAIATYHGHFDLEDRLEQIVGLTASTYLAGAIVVISITAGERDLWYRSIASWPLRKIGQFSYATYVFHLPLSLVLDRTGFVRRQAFDRWFVTELGAELAYVTTLVILSIAVGVVSWHLVEKHFLKWKRYVPYEYAAAPSMGLSQR
jgi:peptidoglycan/LPS O-acetylase OafA/YrhL